RGPRGRTRGSAGGRAGDAGGGAALPAVGDDAGTRHDLSRAGSFGGAPGTVQGGDRVSRAGLSGAARDEVYRCDRRAPPDRSGGRWGRGRAGTSPIRIGVRTILYLACAR